jgi:uroporphyrinogen-III synthase
MSGLPLAGRRIVVTRPRGQSEALAALIRQAGGEALEIPAIEIIDSAQYASLRAVAERLESFDCAIFVSRNAVRRGLALLGERPWPAQLGVAAIGEGSRSELAARGFARVVAPEGRADSEALLALPEFAAIAGRRIALFRGEGGRQYLAETLVARGATVEHAICYRRALPAAGGAQLAAAWAAGTVDAVLLSSGEGLANLLTMLGAEATRRLAGVALFVPHPRVAEDAARRGLDRVVLAGPADAQMAASLVAYFGAAGYN